MKLVDNCFGKEHPLRKICNRNTLKVSYSTMPNFQKIVTGINRSKIDPDSLPKHDLSCSCRYPVCPLNGQCNVMDIVYQADVLDKGSNEKFTYIGMTSENFRKRYAKHKQSFQNIKYKGETTLSKKIWEIKEISDPCPDVTFKILKNSKSYRPGDRFCKLCTDEKIEILLSDHEGLLNSRREMYCKCRHKEKSKIRRIMEI